MNTEKIFLGVPDDIAAYIRQINPKERLLSTRLPVFMAKIMV